MLHVVGVACDTHPYAGNGDGARQLKIDAHQHFFDLERCRYDWLGPQHGVLYRSFGPSDLAPHLDRHGIGGTIAVQASDTVAETRYLLELAQTTPYVRGVVGWVPLENEAGREQLRELARSPKLVGVRPMLQDLADDAWILRDDVAPGLDLVEELDLVLDALVTPRQLGAVVELARRRPGLCIVLDHAAKPDVAAGSTWVDLHRWRDELHALAQAPRAACKLSGLVTEAGPRWKPSDLAEFAKIVFDVFGAPRVIWGSDWPVCLLGGGYDAWCAATAALLVDLTAEERDDVLGSSAVRLYSLDAAHAQESAR